MTMKEGQNVLFLESREEINRFINCQKIEENMGCHYDGKVYFDKNADFFKRYSAIAYVSGVDEYATVICGKARNVAVPVCFFQDGPFEWSNNTENPKHASRDRVLLNPVLATIIYYVGDSSQRYLQACNPSAKFRKFLPRRISKPDSAASYSAPTRPSVMLTTARTPYFTDSEKNKLIAVLTATIKALKHQRIEFSTRFTENLYAILDGGDSLHRDTKASLGEVIKRYDIVITTPSSVSIEALNQKKKLIHLNIRSTPIFYSAYWNINAPEQSAEVLSAACTMQNEHQQYQDYLLGDFYSEAVHGEDIQFLDGFSDVFTQPEFTPVPYLSKSEAKALVSAYENIIASPYNFNLIGLLKKLLRILGIRR